MLDKIITGILLDEQHPENAIGMISALVFHKLLKQANVVIYDIDLEEKDYYFGTFLLKKPKCVKSICKISLESAVKEILYKDPKTEEIWEGLNDPKRLEARTVEILKPRVRLAEILFSSNSFDEAQKRVEAEFGKLGSNVLIMRKGA